MKLSACIADLERYPQLQRNLVAGIEREIKDRSFAGTIVELQTDYEADAAICLTSCCFPSEELGHTIDREVIQPLREIQPEHYYYSADQLHLTIKNIRVIHNPPRFDDADVAVAQKVFADTVPRHNVFTFELEGLIRFPTSLSVVGYCDRGLFDLVCDLDKALRHAGLPDDKSYVSDSIFFGNITVCRFTRETSPTFSKKIETLRAKTFGKLPVTSVSIMSCNAVNRSRKLHGKYLLGPVEQTVGPQRHDS